MGGDRLVSLSGSTKVAVEVGTAERDARLALGVLFVCSLKVFVSKGFAESDDRLATRNEFLVPPQLERSSLDRNSSVKTKHRSALGIFSVVRLEGMKTEDSLASFKSMAWLLGKAESEALLVLRGDTGC